MTAAVSGAATALLAGSCAGSGDLSSPPPRRLRVLAAASLTEVFGELAATFEASHPGTAVELALGGSSALARQLREGADADVFASADEAIMETVVASGDVASPSTFARNRLTIVVEKGNPKGVQGIADLAGRDLAVVVCAPEVPCGRLAVAAFDRARVHVEPRALEPDVKAVLARVALGEADAGLVYATDARAAGERIDEVVMAGTEEPALQAVYRVGVVTRSGAPDLARAWIELLGSEPARRALVARGFIVA